MLKSRVTQLYIDWTLLIVPFLEYDYNCFIITLNPVSEGSGLSPFVYHAVPHDSWGGRIKQRTSVEWNQVYKVHVVVFIG
jgi:hypothetical protein